MTIQMIISGLLISWVCFYALSKLLKERIDYKSSKTWIGLLINALSLIILYLLTNNLIRIIFYYIIFVFSVTIAFKEKNIINIFFNSFVVFFLFFIAEILFAICAIVFLNYTIDDIKVNCFNTLFGNGIVSLLFFVMINIKYIIKFFQNPNFMVYLKNNKNTIAIFTVSILTISMLLYYIFFEIPLLMGFIYILILSVIYLMLILGFFQEKSQNIKLQIKYEMLIKNLNEYEKMLEIQRLNNHENKNHFITIRGMLKDKNHKAYKYISNLLETKIADDEELLYKTKKLPIGGLQGLIYQKLLIMKEKKINISLEVSKRLDTILLEKISDLTNQHLCAIVGVLLDNAIEAVELLNERKVSINVYSEDGYLVITISNNFEGILELNKIEEKGYSTKGKGRGYGLSLAKQIMERDENLKLEREIIGNMFKQKLKLKI
ncbi:MAG: GHKL domain-containing protein [Mollicutes bacterium]|nr:GHKL domain-containing protein [Mollicutes bacterium]